MTSTGEKNLSAVEFHTHSIIINNNNTSDEDGRTWQTRLRPSSTVLPSGYVGTGSVMTQPTSKNNVIAVGVKGTRLQFFFVF